MKQYEHNQICTTNRAIEVGKEYDYTEDCYVMRVRVYSDNSDESGLKFTLEVTHGHCKGDSFNVFAAPGRYAYRGMWRLYDAGEYIHTPSEVMRSIEAATEAK